MCDSCYLISHVSKPLPVHCRIYSGARHFENPFKISENSEKVTEIDEERLMAKYLFTKYGALLVQMIEYQMTLV